MNYLFKDNKNNTNNTRMKRMKLNRGGDGDAHHRSTTDRVGTDKFICRANLSDVMIPLAESPSSVRFRSYHPQRKEEFLDKISG